MRAALLLSVSVHALGAMVAIRHGALGAQVSLRETLVTEIAAPELDAIEAPPEGCPRALPTRVRVVSSRGHASSHEPQARRTADSPPPVAATSIDTAPTPPAPSVIPTFALTLAKTVAPIGGITSSSGRGTSANPRGVESLPETETGLESPAELVQGASPTYTAAAEALGIEADVPFEIVVDRKGSVVEVRALNHVGYGLDEVAERALREYRFSPAVRGGKPVAVRMRWHVRFQLR